MQMDRGGPPEETTTPTTPPQGEQAAPEPEESSEGSQSASSQWFDRVFRRGAQSRNTEEQPPDHPPENQPPAWRPPASPEELDRVVQSRTDAELYRREQLQVQRTLQSLEQQKEQALNDDDPLLVTELERQIRGIRNGDRAQDQVTQVVGSVSDFYDHLFLDTYLGKLDAAARQELLKEPIVGAQGRALLAEKVADALYQQGLKAGEAKADERLRRTPAFRKEVLHEVRGDHPEPEHIEAQATTHRADMNDWIRQAAGR